MKKKMWLAAALALSLTVGILSGCGDAAPGTDLTKGVTDSKDNLSDNTNVSAKTDEEKRIAVTDFAVRLFGQSMEKEKNTLISPLSVLSALAMTANGAEKNTLAQMEEVFGLPVEELNTYLHTYMKSLPVDKKYKLNMANAVWFKDEEGFSVEQDFLQKNEEYYGADIYKAPFDNSTLKGINDWVSKKTDGMIKNILNEIPKEAVMYLVNALCFDAEWQDIYNENQIREGTFTREDNAKQKVEMMYGSENRYLEDENASGFIKPYADGKYAFVALLPEKGVTVADYVASLTGEHLADILENAEATKVWTAIPEFESEYDVEMNDILTEMGMTDAFHDRNADFGRLGHSEAGNIFIDRVIHKTYIRLDAKGTRAGAATAVAMCSESTAFEPEEPKRVYLERPFVYLIIDCQENLPVFMGTVMDVEY